MSSKTENLRRSSRLKAQAKGPVLEENVSASPTNNVGNNVRTTNKPRRPRKSSHIVKEDPDEHIEVDIQRPSELFSDADISGQKVYGFVTPKKKNAMTAKANQCRTPISKKAHTGKTNPTVILERINIDKYKVKKSSSPAKDASRRAANIRRKSATGITTSESESVSESTDYVPSGSESDDVSIEDEKTNDVSSDNESSDEPKTTTKARPIKSTAIIPQPTRRSTRQKSAIIYKDYHVQATEYFESQSAKVVTSDRTLERLHNSRLTKENLDELLASQRSISSRHRPHISKMTENYTSLFPLWSFIMEEGFTVILHGVGSKRCLINSFHRTVAAKHPTLVVNGFFPSLTVKDILDGIITDLLDLPCVSGVNECLELIETRMRRNPQHLLYLLIHNIDGIMLRSNKTQDVLSRLASIANVCVLASVDHINSPLLWDHKRRSKFNFYWWDATTFLPYQEETSYESSLLVQKSGALALSSLRNVFLSLTSNAKSIYILLAKNQLKNGGDASFNGMAFKDLYRAAREGFIVSSDLALRAQLTEFIDHKLVKIKRNIDGVENLMIPLNNSLLKKFLADHDT